ncbi:MAG: hypothetical protein FJ272_20935 [Planctomycetes bacterium]|nr:hypothetical protein [Planctomycetota bacterium]
MTPRERMTRTLNRQKPDKVPKTASFTPTIMELFKQKTGTNNPTEYFKMEPRSVGFKPTTHKPDFSRYFESCTPSPPDSTIDEWGTARVPGTFYHFTRRVFPMAAFQTAREVHEYPWPDMKADYRHAHLEADVKRLHDAGYLVNGGVGHIFETAWQLRGMDRLFMDYTDNPDIAAAIFDHITDLKRFVARRLAEAGCECLHCGDDVGMQDRLMMSPACWRQWLKPRFASVIQAGRQVNPNIHVFYHSDGYIEPIIPDLIEIGVTVLNPVQPECMDPAKTKRQYGHKLAFWGTMGTQSTMPFGTPDEVRRVVKERIETVGYDGGLVLAPTHTLEPEVPWENIVAFFEAVEQYGVYR